MSKNVKIILLVLIIAAVVFTIVSAINYRFSQDVGISGWGEKIGLVQIYGEITSSDDVIEWIERLRQRDDIVAVLVDINSPGGTVGSSHEIYDALKKCRTDGKLVVASLRDVAASGGYYIAVGCDVIFANPGTITGSIGVVHAFPDYTELAEKIGVDLNVIKSGTMKDAGSPFRKLEKTERAIFQTVVDDVYEQFLETVATGRNMEIEEIKQYADGRVFSGRQAFTYGLIDSLGTRGDAISFIADKKNLGTRPIFAEMPQKKLSFLEFFMNPTKEILSNLRGFSSIEYRMP